MSYCGIDMCGAIREKAYKQTDLSIYTFVSVFFIVCLPTYWYFFTFHCLCTSLCTYVHARLSEFTVSINLTPNSIRK